MAWFRRKKKGIQTNTQDKKDTPEGLWHKTPSGKIVDNDELIDNNYVSPEDNFHLRIGSNEYFKILFDNNEYDVLFDNLVSADPLKFIDTKSYPTRVKDAKKKTGLIIIGGKSRHYHFRPKVLMKQIEWILNDLYNDYQWKITTSPRSPDLKMPKHLGNAEFFNWKDTSDEWLTTEIKKSEITFLTPESVSILYEALSTNSNVYVFHHELHRDHGTEGAPLRKTKVTKNIELLKKSKDIGFIDTKRYLFSRDIKSADICHPKKNKPLSEVKDVVNKLFKIL